MAVVVTQIAEIDSSTAEALAALAMALATTPMAIHIGALMWRAPLRRCRQAEDWIGYSARLYLFPVSVFVICGGAWLATFGLAPSSAINVLEVAVPAAWATLCWLGSAGLHRAIREAGCAD